MKKKSKRTNPQTTHLRNLFVCLRNKEQGRVCVYVCLHLLWMNKHCCCYFFFSVHVCLFKSFSIYRFNWTYRFFPNCKHSHFFYLKWISFFALHIITSIRVVFLWTICLLLLLFDRIMHAQHRNIFILTRSFCRLHWNLLHSLNEWSGNDRWPKTWKNESIINDLCGNGSHSLIAHSTQHIMRARALNEKWHSVFRFAAFKWLSIAWILVFRCSFES